MKRVSISALNSTPSAFIHDCHTEPVEITRHGKTVAYLVSPQNVNLSTNFSINNISSVGGEDEKTHNHS